VDRPQACLRWRAYGFGLGTDILTYAKEWLPISAHVRIGTSGWHYRHWRENFYPAELSSKQYLSWYVRHFDTVEINNCFYRLPTESSVESWRQGTPSGFCFAVKASRFITHIKRLREAEDALAAFVERMAGLQRKLGPILFQLPPNWHVNLERLSGFLAVLPKGPYQYVCEFRDPTWYAASVYDLLRKHNVALCIHDLHGQLTPMELTADLTYVRFHGATGKYQGSYTQGMLQKWAERICEWSPKLRDVWVYFNNDIAGHAVRNAQTLQAILTSQHQSRCA
jgi:uncharacterized protein YecE (DUF72 family)